MAGAYQAVGTVTTQNLSSSPTTCDIAWPTHQAGDIGICFVHNKNTDFTPPSGWTKIGFSGSGAAEGSTSYGVGVYWRMAQSSSEAAFTAPSQLTVVGCIITVRGGKLTGDPTDVFQVQNATGSGTSVTVTGVTTIEPSDLVIFCATARNASNWTFSTWTNPSGVTITSRIEGGSGVRRLALATGTPASTGATGDASIATGGITIGGSACATVAIKWQTGSPFFALLMP